MANLRPTVPAPAGSRLLSLSHQSPGTTATAALVTAVTDISSAFYWGPAERESQKD